MKNQNLSHHSILEASRYRSEFSGHGQAKGAAGYRTQVQGESGEFLSHHNDVAVINPPAGAPFGQIHVGFAWDMIKKPETGFFRKLFSRHRIEPVDLDLGCLYELKSGARGCIQSFGDHFGAKDEPPYIYLSGDERTGAAEGHDEYMIIDGRHWNEIERLLFYAYIYHGASDWKEVRPQVHIGVPGADDVIISPDVGNDSLPVCVISQMVNVRGGIKIINHTEYFPGHAEMDRAFGFGLAWEDGKKS